LQLRPGASERVLAEVTKLFVTGEKIVTICVRREIS
jgi:hypothetical protein